MMQMLAKWVRFYRIIQHVVAGGWLLINRLARVATSNTSSTPSPVRAEHSRQRLAPICRAIVSASCGVIKGVLRFRISSMAAGWVRRSFLRPTSSTGTLGQSSLTSSIHLFFALSKLSELSTAKPIRITWALEYDSGRSRFNEGQYKIRNINAS